MLRVYFDQAWLNCKDSSQCCVLDSIPRFSIDMYSSKSFVLVICLSLSIGKNRMIAARMILWLFCRVSLVLLWCSVNGSTLDSSEQQDQPLQISDDDFDDLMDMYRRASLRPFILHQRAAPRSFHGKRASLRPVNGKRASLRPMGKRASLRPNYFQWRDQWIDQQHLLVMIWSCCFRLHSTVDVFLSSEEGIKFHRTNLFGENQQEFGCF